MRAHRFIGYRGVGFLCIAGMGIALVAGSSAAATAAKPKPLICMGTFKKPGELTGNFPIDVMVKGVCDVGAGRAHVIGTLTVARNATLLAAFGRNHLTHKGGSSLIVTGNLIVDKGGTLVLGCKTNPDGSGFPCFDDRNKKHPTLKSAARVTGNLIERAPLGVIVHNANIGGSVKVTGGGGGLTCRPHGAFKKIKNPVFSGYEDASVGHSLTVTGLKSCWLGVARVRVKGNLTFTNDKLADPDAIEILANKVGGNLACSGNSSVWDDVETSMSQFPRAPAPNTVHGKRSGQCILSSPTTMGGKSGPGPF